MLGGLFVVVGLCLTTVGVRLATIRRRPASLGGALLAPAGLGLALLGAARIAAPSFFGP